MAPRILIFGTGSVGATYGYVLSQAVSPSNIVTICRSNYDAAFANGFTINSTIWGRSLNYRPHVVRSPSEAAPLGPFSHIIIASKILPNTPSIPSLLQPIISPTTTLVLIQNGIQIEEPYSTAFSHNPILSCTTYLPVTQTYPATVEHTVVEHLHVGTYPATNVSASHKEAAKSFAALIRWGGATCTLHDDIQGERWNKLLINTWNHICALSRSRDAQFLLASPYALDYVADVMREVTYVAKSEGYPIEEDFIQLTLRGSKNRKLPGVEPSMLADVLAGKSMEVDALLGNVVRIAEENGVDVPLLRGNYALLKALDESLKRERVGGEGRSMVDWPSFTRSIE